MFGPGLKKQYYMVISENIYYGKPTNARKQNYPAQEGPRDKSESTVIAIGCMPNRETKEDVL